MKHSEVIKQTQGAIISVRNLANDLEVIVRMLDQKHTIILGTIQKLEKALENLKQEEQT